MPEPFIQLDRRFEEYHADESPDSQAQRSYLEAFLGHEHGSTWIELLQKRLVVVLGEPGCGKTRELLAQHARLEPSSFFLPLNRLVDEDVKNILDGEKARFFERWKKGNFEATFFLDAVDESKFKRDDDFYTALERVRKAVGSSLNRARFVISSRISEWRHLTDCERVRRCFGINQASSSYSSQDEERLPTGNASTTSTEQSPSHQDEGHQFPSVLVVKFLPLSRTQVERYASAFAVKDIPGFIAALDKGNTWRFARRPLDVRNLFAYWNAYGELSNLTNITEYMVGRLLAEVPNREKQDILTPEKAREGAELLAAAVILSRRLRIRPMDDEISTEAEHLINPSEVLPESWTPGERRALTDRALFDAASYGTISFHHRNHVEYLAAAWVERLMANNCGLEALEDLLFTIVDGQHVLRPSLAPVAAWLVKEKDEPWRQRLSRLLQDTAPEIHLIHGDPASLPHDYRRNILRNLIERYKGRKYARLDWNHEALTRLADPALAEDIQSYLLDEKNAEDLRAYLLMIVRAGKLSACMTNVLEVFVKPSTSDRLRVYAATVVRDIGNTHDLKLLGELWPNLHDISNSLLGRLCEALYPKVVDAEGLVTLLRRSNEVKRFRIDLPHVLKPHLERELNASMAEELLPRFIDLLREEPLHDKSNLSDHYIWIINLLPICLRKMLEHNNSCKFDYKAAGDAIMLIEEVQRHGLSNICNLDSEEINYLQNCVSQHHQLKRLLFWRCINRYRRSEDNKIMMRYECIHRKIARLSRDDIFWLLSDVKNLSNQDDQYIALIFSSELMWSSRQSILGSLLKMVRASENNAALWAYCSQYAWRRLWSPISTIWYFQVQHKILTRYWWKGLFRNFKEVRHRVYERWWIWRHLGALREGRYPRTLAYFAKIANNEKHTQYGASDWNNVSKECGESIAMSAKAGCIAVWKQFAPPLPHEKSAQNVTDYRTIAGLSGLQTLWRENRLVFLAFSHDQVDSAVRYAFNELNGLPEWFLTLLELRPEDAVRTLDQAVSGEWELPKEQEHVYDLIAKFAWMPNPPELIMRSILKRLQHNDPSHPNILKYSLAILLRNNDLDIQRLASIAPERVSRYTTEQPQWHSWMSAWLHLDALPALDHLEQSLSRMESDDQADGLVVRLCAAIYGRREGMGKSSHLSYLEAAQLGRLIPLVYKHVRPSDDLDIDAQGANDFAQEFRSFLWERLEKNPDPIADNVLHAFMSMPLMSDRRDWILHLLDGRRGLRAEKTIWEPRDVRSFSTDYCSEPRSDYSLFQLVKRLLKDIKGFIEYSENAANRLQIRPGDQERDIRGFLDGKLKERSRGWFSVTQESVVDLEQRSDLRVDRPGLNPIPLEIKLLDKGWSMSKLMDSLENQLVGKYLRAKDVRFGFFVLGNTNPSCQKNFDGRRINFAEVVKIMRKRADDIQAELREGVDGIGVVGIDFSVTAGNGRPGRTRPEN